MLAAPRPARRRQLPAASGPLGPASRAGRRSLGCGRVRPGRGRRPSGAASRPPPPPAAGPGPLRAPPHPRSPVTVTSSGRSVCPSLPASLCLSPSPGLCRVSLSPFLSRSLPRSPALLLTAPLYSLFAAVVLSYPLSSVALTIFSHSLFFLSCYLPSLSTPCSLCSGGLFISPSLEQQPQPQNPT